MRPRILLWLALLCWSWLPMTGGAETRALLIGASVYAPGLGIADLKGPPNDIRLLKATLQARGVRDIRLLADQVVGAKRPTHAAILQAFADLATASRPGDLVFIALSGHGTQQPDQNGDESDGLDEVFLPSDTGRAEAGARAIPQALVDDEIGAAVLAIRQRGADVVLVLDSCHSGSGLREAAPKGAARSVDPALLWVGGVAASGAGDSAVDSAVVGGGAAEAPGGVLGRYAARSGAVAREVNMTPQAAGDAGWAVHRQTGGTAGDSAGAELPAVVSGGAG